MSGGVTTTSAGREVSERLWILIVAGIPTGVVVAGVGSRVAMLVLRLTSPAWVNGVTSDDGFEIGRFTLSGTYNLLVLGAAVGLVGAAAYRAVAPWLLGPVWFRYLTVAAASGAVVGSMLIHADGVDFVVLEPLWLAIALFVGLPAIFGAAVAVAVDRVSERSVQGGRPGWTAPVVLVLAFPLVIPVLAVVASAVTCWVLVRRALESAGLGAAGVPRGIALGARAAWLTVALLGLVALVGDVRSLM